MWGSLLKGGEPFIFNSRVMYKVLEENRVSELVAKRRAIEGALEYWADNDSDYFCELKVSYISLEDNDRVWESLVARREVVSQYLKLECLSYWRYKGNSLRLHKVEYLELWEMLKEQEIKDLKVWDRLKGLFKRKK